MTEANPYRPWVEKLAASLQDAEAIELPPRPAATRPQHPGPKALIFSPHPDDEVIIGALPLRLSRECGFAVVNVAVTLGSKVERRAERGQELQAACAYLGFELVALGLDAINPEARLADPARWAASVASVARLLEAESPLVAFLPHAQDWNRTHVGVHSLVIEAMRSLPALGCLVVETEYWGAMAAPNLMVESSPTQVAELVAALSLHRGEVARNPYHLRLPAWMIDNVRRGAELVLGQGSAAPPFTFATLYRLRCWGDGGLHEILGASRTVAAAESPAPLFPPWR